MSTRTETTEPERCPACAAQPGQPHSPDCDVARCLTTGLQRLGCPYDHDCGADRWTGQWPGEAECREYGFLTASGHADLNRLYAEARWDPTRRRWVTPQEPETPDMP